MFFIQKILGKKHKNKQNLIKKAYFMPKIRIFLIKQDILSLFTDALRIL